MEHWLFHQHHYHFLFLSVLFVLLDTQDKSSSCIILTNLQCLETYQVGLTGIPLDKDPQSLSGGYKRRLALAIQLVRFFFLS